MDQTSINTKNGVVPPSWTILSSLGAEETRMMAHYRKENLSYPIFPDIKTFFKHYKMQFD